MIWVITEVEDSFSFWVEHCSGYTFYSDHGFHNGGWRSVHGENLADGVREKTGFCFYWVCFG